MSTNTMTYLSNMTSLLYQYDINLFFLVSPQLLALRHRQDAENGVAIRAYAVDLGNDTSTTFSQAVSNFITCTLESPEKDPAIVTRNVRQFMSGMKNYLVTSGEKEFEAIVKKQQSNVSSLMSLY